MVEKVTYSESTNLSTIAARRWRAQNRQHANDYMKLYMRFWRARRRVRKIEALKPAELNTEFRQKELLLVKKRMIKNWNACQEYLLEHEKLKERLAGRDRLEM